ncbi:MAG: DUF1553 domain-containing protein, partial [Zavarzinella sp.]|nr:DUF1553 domain-containing protein [Zavarzinella sp.]
PSGEACVARREVSNTPLQALTLLNDQVFVEAAQALGRRLAAAQASPEAKARELLRHCLVRNPDPDEVKMVVGFYEAQKKRLAEKSGDLIALAGDDEVLERAAWTAAARAVLNLDETLTKE